MSEGWPTRFPSYLRIRAPEKLPDPVPAAANKKFTTASEYVRQAIIEELNTA